MKLIFTLSSAANDKNVDYKHKFLHYTKKAFPRKKSKISNALNKKMKCIKKEE